jgi:hypothetical protein
MAIAGLVMEESIFITFYLFKITPETQDTFVLVLWRAEK